MIYKLYRRLPSRREVICLISKEGEKFFCNYYSKPYQYNEITDTYMSLHCFVKMDKTEVTLWRYDFTDYEGWRFPNEKELMAFL